VGGWEAAGQLPFDTALEIAEEQLKNGSLESLRHAQLCWHSALGLYSQGGAQIPDPPALDGEDEDDW